VDGGGGVNTGEKFLLGVVIGIVLGSIYSLIMFPCHGVGW